MTYLLNDAGFHTHRKVLLLRRLHSSQAFAQSIGMWFLAQSWCGQHSPDEGIIPNYVLETLGVDDWDKCADALIRVGLWEYADDSGEVYVFHDWTDWNGPDARANRNRKQATERKAAQRRRDCSEGRHSKDCPPETCPEKIARRDEKQA